MRRGCFNIGVGARADQFGDDVRVLQEAVHRPIVLPVWRGRFVLRGGQRDDRFAAMQGDALGAVLAGLGVLELPDSLSGPSWRIG